MTTERCVAGLLICEDEVVLIQKTHPEWQKGRLNGVGGHIEEGETPLQAMVREFKEEAGVYVTNWRQFCHCQGKGYEVYWFVCKAGKLSIKTMTNEKVAWYWIYGLSCWPTLPILDWVIPMANYKFPITAEVIHESPEC